MNKKSLFSIFLLGCFFLFSNKTLAQCINPGTQASNVQVSYKYPSGTAVTITWSRGNGGDCMVVLKKSSSTLAVPPSSSSAIFNASASYGTGTSLGGGDNFVVYKGTGTGVYVYNLAPNTIYDAYVYEYNTCTIFSTVYYYNTNTSSAYGFNTLAAPATTCGGVSSVSSIASASATVNFTAGNGNGRFATIGLASGSASNPTNGYSYTANTVYGSGSVLGAAYVIYNNSGISTPVTGLAGATTYKVNSYEYTNGSYPTYYIYEYNTKNYYSCGSYTFNTVNFPPTITSVPSMTICQDASTQAVSLSGIGDGSTNETQNLTVSATSNNTGLIPNPSISYASPNATGTLNYTPVAGQYGTAIITVTVNDGWSVNNITTITFTVIVKPKPGAAGAISGSNHICSGTTQTYSISPTTNTTGYTWSVPSTFTITSGGGTNNITVTSATNYSSNVSGIFSVYGTNANICGNGTASSLLVQFDAQPVAPNAGADQPLICGTSASLNATAVPANNSGVWTWYAGTPVPSIGTTTVNSTSISGLTGPNNTYKYIWTVTRASSVCPSKTDTVAVSTDWNNVACSPAANFAYSPTSDVVATKVCVNTPINFIDLSVSANTWSWNFNYPTGTGTYTTTTQNPVFTYTAIGTYTVHLQIHSNTTGLNYNTNQVINVIGAPAAPGTIFGTTSGICEGSSSQYVYSISNVTDATGYNWTTPPRSDTAAFPSLTSIAVVYPAGASNGNITVSASNSCGTSLPSTLAVTINPLPNSAGNTISGLTTVCQGQTPLTYSISSISHATSYLWTDILGTQTNTTNTFTTGIGTNATNGQISVIGSNACGTGDTVRLPITVNPLPINNGSINGVSTIGVCPTPGNLTYAISPAISNASSYNWTLPTGASVVGGNGNDTIIVAYTNTIAGGFNQISVTGTNGCGTTSASTYSVFVNTPTAPQLCMVTVDSASTHNILYWDKTAVLNADSFKIYREDVTNVYTHIGTVHYNALSEYHDMDPVANPNTTTKRYKISAIDSCGNESAMSPWHNTIYITDNGSGQFSWINLYLIEPSTNPVNNYVLMVDSLNNGNWVQIASTAGNQHNLNDVHYANYASVANWRIETIWGISCLSTARSIGMGAQAAVVRSKSNISNNRGQSTGIKNIANDKVGVYPNPTTGNLTIRFANATQGKTNIKVLSLLGEEVLNENVTSTTELHNIDLSNYQSGTYLVQITNGNSTVTKRIVKN